MLKTCGNYESVVNQVLINVDLVFYFPGGITVLWPDVKTTTVELFNVAEDGSLNVTLLTNPFAPAVGLAEMCAVRIDKYTAGFLGGADNVGPTSQFVTYNIKTNTWRLMPGRKPVVHIFPMRPQSMLPKNLNSQD